MTRNFENVWNRCLGVAVAVAAVAVLISLLRNGLPYYGIGWFSSGSPPKATLRVPPHDGAEEGYVSSSSCATCHPEQYNSWYSTYHRTMTMPATGDAVRLAVGEVELHARGKTYHIKRENDEYWVEMPDPDWDFEGEHHPKFKGRRIRRVPIVRKRIEMTTGSHHQQCFWVASNRGRYLWMLPWSYHIATKRWVPLEDNFVRPPEAGRIYSRWDDNCIRCHSVAGNPHLDQRTGHTTSSVAELGIACESCHGPGGKHVALSEELATTDAENRSNLEIVNPFYLDAELSSHICAQCHSVTLEKSHEAWARHGSAFRPGDDLRKTRQIIEYDDHPTDPGRQQLLRQEPDFLRNTFWPDGTVRVAGRDFNAMRLSACFEGGKLSCLSCHSMHSYASVADQLLPDMDTNAACLQCHDEFRDKIELHTHHTANSSGSVCYNCHMPHTTIGLMKNIRSHRITSPTILPKSTADRPNACNLCHLDKSFQWTADSLQKWYGISAGKVAEENREIAASIIWLLKGDAAQRVVTAWHMGWAPAQDASMRSWQAPYLALLMEDPYAVVRQIALSSLRTLPEFAHFEGDALAGLTERKDIKDRIIERWKAVGGFPVAVPNHVLLNSDGSFSRPQVVRLLQERDQTPISVRE
jgi:predicted CXXCH cytochrome family protein